MRLLIVQYAGDYGEAVKRFASGGGETYYAQKYSVDAVAEIAKQTKETTVLCCLTPAPYNEMLENGVRAIGAGFNQSIDPQALIQLIAAQRPTHLVLTAPIREVLRWTIRNQVQAAVVLADSFNGKDLRSRFRGFRLSQLLNHDRIAWIGNHGIGSSLTLRHIGVKPRKIIPWDWPAIITPAAFEPKMLTTNSTRNLIYVGALSEAKGLGDVLEAIAQLKAQNYLVHLKVAGKREQEYFINKAKQLQIEDAIEFLGLVPHDRVVSLMNAADAVIVPSRHDYPEGVPMTIYEALCSRTPIVASDHPMFRSNLRNNVDALIFPAGDVPALANSLQKLFSDANLYSKISFASQNAWEQLQIPVKWADLLKSWVFDSPENQQWRSKYQLDSAFYRDRLAKYQPQK
jgi:glycosyltransferase involved in cell wall biosynthesis